MTLATAAPAIRRVRACVVGSGITGLLTAIKLRDLDIPSVLLEKEAQLGGIWCSPRMYQAVRLQQHKSEFVMPGKPWPSETPDYPTVSDVRRYLKDFILEQRLNETALTNAPVTSARFNWDTRTWLVQAENTAPIEADWIGLATGGLGAARSMAPGALAGFQGPVVHSTSYFHAAPFLGMHVVLVGLGASSVEIAGDLAKHGVKVTLLARPEARADWILPRFDAAGKPLKLSSNGDTTVTRAARAGAARAAVSARLGGKALRDVLPPALAPAGEPLDGRIIVSETFLDGLRDGQIRVVVGDTQYSEDDSLYYASAEGTMGRVRNVGAVVTCVGFENGASVWEKIMDPKPSGVDLYQTAFAPQVPQAAFLGVGYGFVAAPTFANLHAEGFARAVTGELTLPDEADMEQWIANTKRTNLMGTTNTFTDNAYVKEVQTFLTGSTDFLTASAMDEGKEDEARDAAAEASLSDVAQRLLDERFVVESEESVQATYAAWANTYDTDSFDALRFDSPEVCVLAALAHWPRTETHAYAPDVAVLDVGCGTGALGELLQLKSAKAPGVLRSKLHGFDLTDSMLDVCRQRGLYTGSLRQHSVTAYPWPYETASMDLVMCNGVLIYVQDPNCLDEMVRVLKPGGAAVIMIRKDGFETYARKIRELEAAGEWRLQDVSETRDNFPGGAGERVKYNIFVFRRDEGAMAEEGDDEVELLSG